VIISAMVPLPNRTCRATGIDCGCRFERTADARISAASCGNGTSKAAAWLVILLLLPRRILWTSRRRKSGRKGGQDVPGMVMVSVMCLSYTWHITSFFSLSRSNQTFPHPTMPPTFSSVIVTLFILRSCLQNRFSKTKKSSILPVVSAMKLVVQRVKSASVSVDNTPISTIGPGILALVGLHIDDTPTDLQYCVKRLLNIKLWENESGVPWRKHVKQLNYEILCVSQFTLYGTLSKKYQPDYKLAMKSERARSMYTQFLELLREGYEESKILDGEFGKMMDVMLVNDGPVTLVVDSRKELNDRNTVVDSS
jgi:D-tyrosyl-tRNA(Tyr) deacylase